MRCVEAKVGKLEKRGGRHRIYRGRSDGQRCCSNSLSETHHGVDFRQLQVRTSHQCDAFLRVPRLTSALFASRAFAPEHGTRRR